MPKVRPTLALAVAAAVIAALVQSFVLPLDCDVSWLITVNEKMLAGQRLYVDVIEVNPPASIWLYTPSVWLAHALGFRPEAVVVATFIAVALISCASTLRLNAHLRRPSNPLLLAALLSFAELLLPLGTFAQREHAALLLAVPALATLAVLADGGKLALTTRLMAGVAAGLVIVIKPHFALVIVPAALFATWRARRLRPAAPVGAAALAVVATYALAVVALTPQFLELLPMLAETYLPLREQWSTLLLGPVFMVPFIIYVLAATLRPRRVDTLPAILLIGSAGFALAALIQAKGYLNHALPAMALGFIALVLTATEPRVERSRRRLVLMATAVLACFELYAMSSIRPIPGLAEAVDRVGPPRPSMITLGPELYMGHPLVRNAGGRWVGSRAALFIAVGAQRQFPSTSGPAKARLLRWYDEDIAAFAEDVRREHPDVILVDSRPELKWLREEPRIRDAIAGYSPRARVEDVEIWVRRSTGLGHA